LANVSQHQFVVTADGLLKLHHILSLQYEEPSCSSTHNCTIDHKQLAICSPLGRCNGYNTKRNIQVFTEKFFIPLLTDDIPSKHNDRVAGVLKLLRDSIESPSKGNTEDLAMIQDTINNIHSSMTVATTAAPTTVKQLDTGKTVKGEFLVMMFNYIECCV